VTRSNLFSGINVPISMPFFRLLARRFCIPMMPLVALSFAGCPTANQSAPAKAVPVNLQTLVLLVVDDPRLGEAIKREWRGTTEKEVTVLNVSASDLATANRLPGDAVIFAGGLIGLLAERGLIVPIEPAALEDSKFNYRDIFDQIRLREMRWAGRSLAAPLGSPQLLLAYRPDCLARAGLEPPSDWASYQQAIARLAERSSLGDLAPSADQPWQAAIEPLADGWAGQLLLARAAAYALHREHVSPLFRFENLEPLIDQPPYIRALEELVAAAKTGGFSDRLMAPAQVFAELQAGHCAMAISWPPADAAETSTGQTNQQIAFDMLPGATQAYRFATKTWEDRAVDESSHVPLLSISGRMAAVAASTSDPGRAQSLVLWLAGREVSQQIGSHSAATTLFRNSQVTASSRWTSSLSPESSRQYADVLAQSLNSARAFPGLTLPGRIDYLAALDEAVRQAIDGKPASEALADAAKKWRGITDKLGVESQRRANARSLGQGEL
jgi:ABC-type glycerol-3-phosphate transport system substrate-binding protein